MTRRPALAITALVGLALLAAGASAQQRTLEDARNRLVAAKSQAAQARARSERLEREAAAAADAAQETRTRAAAVAARIQGAEADIAAAEARVAIVEALRRAQAQRLARQQGPIVRLVAALQSLARRPSATTLVQPGSLTDLVHVRALLATTIPAIETRTSEVRGELARARRLRDGEVLALRALQASREKLAAERVSLARLEASERVRSRDLGRSAMLEQDRAIALGEEARDIVDLMEEIGVQSDVRARLAALPDPQPRPGTGPAAPPPPEQAETSDRPAYRLPLAGDIVAGLGEVSRAGVRARGLTIAPRPAALAVAPAGGKVAFAGRFRSYGEIVIIDHGAGWTSLVSGLAGLRVRTGDALTDGAPIGRAAGDQPRVTVELRRHGRPVDIATLLG